MIGLFAKQWEFKSLCFDYTAFRQILSKGINMILYLTLILKYWQYIVIALCSIAIVALLIRCNILDERNTSLKKELSN